MNQKEAFELFFPLIQSYGKEYYKISLVYAEMALPGDYVETWTSDGLETTNYAKHGDFIVQNIQTEYQEKYIVSHEMFFKRYKFFYYHDKGAIYMPIGKVKAIIYNGQDCEFIAKWDRNMSLKTGDFIATPLPYMDEVYRIAAKEFFESYELSL